MLFFNDISEILDDIILSKMNVSACRSLLDSLFPYGYHSVDSGCYDVRKEILINGDGNYHVTAYDLPYIDACEKLVKFESNDLDAYPILFAMIDSTELKADYLACSLIKIFSCAYEKPSLVIFVSDERIAFGTVRSLKPVEDNFCLSNWFLPSDFDTKVSFVEDAYSLSDVIVWIKANSQLENTKRGSKKKKRKTDSNRVKSWNYNCYDFNLDYIHALQEFEYVTGISTERQRYEYYLSFDDEMVENRSDVVDEEENYYLEYSFDDIASEISYVGNITHFEELDEYSDDLESIEINGNVVEPDNSDSFDLLDYDEDIPDDVLNDPEKLLKYLDRKKIDDTSEHQGKLAQKVRSDEAGQITFDSLYYIEPIHYPEAKPKSNDTDEADTVIEDVSEGEPVPDEAPEPEAVVSGVIDEEPVADISGMISHFKLISMVNVHSETVFRYIHEKKIIPDRVIKKGSRSKYYFTPENVKEIICKFDWHIISESNKRRVFLQMIDKMTMSFSYKPVFIKAFFATAKNGKSSMNKIVAYFRDFYETRRKLGLFVEKPNSIFANTGYTDKDIKKLIIVYPYKRFAEMQMFTYSNLLGTVSMDPNVWSSLHSSEILEICRMCDEHIENYYNRFA